MTHRFLRIFCVSFAILILTALPILAQTPASEPTPALAKPSEAPATPAGPAEIPQTVPPAPLIFGTTQHDIMQPPAPVPPAKPHMSLLNAAIIGVVEGVTEYLPVSSTGHIILTQRAMGIGTESEQAKEAADAFAICVQAGAILAVLGLYFGRVKQGVRGLIGKDPVGLRLSINLIVAFLPALVLGVLLSKTIKAHLFGLWPIAIAWFVGGIAILYISFRKPKPVSSTPGTEPAPTGFALDVLNWQSALMVGFAQCLAMWPGTSRSLVTIVAGVLIGMSLPAAVEFSFLLGVITLTAATVKDLKDHGRMMLDFYGALTLFVGFFAAFISAVAAIEWLVTFLKKHSMAVFGYYRIALALIVAALLLAKIIHP